MRYFGGKNRISHYLEKVINPIANKRGSYIEPFVGGGSVLSRIKCPVRVASDINVSLINMWIALSEGWIPPKTLSEQEYDELKEKKDPENPLTAFAGFGTSYAGKWFGGYARSDERNYAGNASSSLLKKLVTMKGVIWSSGNYIECPITPRAVIYCDPPYHGTTGYAGIPEFDWEEFWEWCRDKSKKGYVVLISEYKAPNDFKAIIEIPTKTDISGDARTEKLFIHESLNIFYLKRIRKRYGGLNG